MKGSDIQAATAFVPGLLISGALVAALFLNAADDGPTVAVEKATIYARPSTGSPVVATLEKGQPVALQLQLTEASGCWMEIAWQRFSGYVRCEDIQQPAPKQPVYVPAAPSPPPGAKPVPAPKEQRPTAPAAQNGALALTHVRVLDGTGAYARQDQTIIIERGRIREIGNTSSAKLTGVTQTLDLSGDTALPGLVGMHDHLFYALPPTGSEYRPMLSSFPKLYLASGVTTIRTAGNGDLNGEIQLKRQIDQGREVGPRMYLSAYVNGNLSGPENPSGLAQLTERLIAAGVGSIKIYTTVRPSELAAVVEASHRRGSKVTGHLCASGFSEAADAGIDNLEHGLLVDTEFYSGRQPGTCPDQGLVELELISMDVRGPQIQGLIRTLVSRGVALTSTLAVFETFSAQRMQRLDERTLPMLAQELQPAYQQKRNSTAGSGMFSELALRKEMEFEREFVRAGGLLMAGVDPTGWGGVIAGLGDQREIELLVEAGFRPEEAIQIATSNGAQFLGQADRLGTLAAGKLADLVVVRGDPVSNVRNIENTEIVIKDGNRYDPAALRESVAGLVGRQ